MTSRRQRDTGGYSMKGKGVCVCVCVCVRVCVCVCVCTVCAHMCGCPHRAHNIFSFREAVGCTCTSWHACPQCRFYSYKHQLFSFAHSLSLFFSLSLFLSLSLSLSLSLFLSL